jgi:ferredoxin-thioredoxin reductase catalytic chain
MSEPEYNPTPEEIAALYERMDKEAEEGGYHLNPDRKLVTQLVEGILRNQARYGYWSCPCRLADGVRLEDLDIICPCDYRDPDLNDYGCCYCSLYVSDEVKAGKKQAHSIPERRPDNREERAQFKEPEPVAATEGGMRIWRCRVCGYVCVRKEPPLRCPVCKATKDRFEPLQVMIKISG